MTDIISIIAEGGCYWPALKQGVALAFPNGTPFRIAIDGEKSYRFGRGTCSDGYFVLDNGERFDSANGVVGEVRKHKAKRTNAYLYIDFLLDGEWQRAEDIRARESKRADDEHFLAVGLLTSRKQAYANLMKAEGMPADPVRALRAAARALLRQREVTAPMGDASGLDL